MTIVEFLEERLGEDEWNAYRGSFPARRDRDRALADIQAKRRIVAGYQEAYRACTSVVATQARAAGHGPAKPDPADADGTLSALWAWREALKHLASVYSDHPDYDRAWEA
ncbi:hypothetical protein F4561_002845 [Lipingzhangella halophila]|uniref:Uncharacterized protein n=1 Tax=Lipingzhangella halophila TaxID=1783352 RepID=A0A7W7W3S5_9ACTN|nr:DUF6221 family protein [Lipingzhangella halophila]MBB4932025.1 hypothetical protein [Lipingzhangella halophila]